MSSSSSLCDFDEYCNYHPLRSYEEPWFDYYQAMGHPLIYYAEVQPSSRRSRSGKDPNFFVKAFRWYTQEHHPPLQGQEKAAVNPDFSGFADWLDTKYGQYIQEEQQVNRLNAPEPTKPKKLLATMKSHFTRRHKTKKDNARQKRSCNSCEYIMQPKDVSLTASDCRRSNIKAVCSETREKKIAMKSVSMNSSRYDVDYQKSIEIIVTEGDTNDKPEEDTCSCAKTEVLTIYESKPRNVNVSVGALPCDPQNVDVICECEPPAKVNTSAQYDKNKGVSAPPVHLAPQNVSVGALPCDPQNVNVICECGPTAKVNASAQYDKNKGISAPPVHPAPQNVSVGTLPCDPPNMNVVCECGPTAKVNASAQYVTNKGVSAPPVYPAPPNVCVGALPCDSPNVNVVCECRPPAKANASAQYDKNMGVSAPPVPSKNKVEMRKEDKNKLSDASIAKKTSNPKKPKTSNVSCQCSVESVPSSQPTKSITSAYVCKCTASFQDVVKAVYQKNKKTDAICCSPSPTPRPSPSTVPAPMATPVAPLPPPPPPVVTLTTTGCLCSVRVNETMQTSDTSIRLDDEVTKYPFFMKIVRADKLVMDC